MTSANPTARKGRPATCPSPILWAKKSPMCAPKMLARQSAPQKRGPNAGKCWSCTLAPVLRSKRTDPICGPGANAPRRSSKDYRCCVTNVTEVHFTICSAVANTAPYVAPKTGIAQQPGGGTDVQARGDSDFRLIGDCRSGHPAGRRSWKRVGSGRERDLQAVQQGGKRHHGKVFLQDARPCLAQRI